MASCAAITRAQTLVGLRTEYNYLAGTIKNYFSLQIAPRPDKFYLIEIVDDPRGFREKTQTSTDSSERGLVTETTVKTSLDKLRFSLQFGRRFGIFTGRAGIKESTGGIGADLRFLNDRLTLSVDLFDARSNEYPRLQGRGAWAIYNKNLYLVGRGRRRHQPEADHRRRRGLLRLVLRHAARGPGRRPEVDAPPRRRCVRRRGRELTPDPPSPGGVDLGGQLPIVTCFPHAGGVGENAVQGQGHR